MEFNIEEYSGDNTTGGTFTVAHGLNPNTPHVVILCPVASSNTHDKKVFLRTDDMGAGESAEIGRTSNAITSTDGISGMDGTNVTIHKTFDNYRSATTYAVISIYDDGSDDFYTGSVSVTGDDQEVAANVTEPLEVVVAMNKYASAGSFPCRVHPSNAALGINEDNALDFANNGQQANFIQEIDVTGANAIEFGSEYNSGNTTYYIEFNTPADVTYAGDTTDARAITLSDQPVLAFITDESTGYGYLRVEDGDGDGHGGDAATRVNTEGVTLPITNKIEAFGATSVTVGADMNASATTYHVWWIALPSAPGGLGIPIVMHHRKMLEVS
jgi:hypothetical protein